MNENYKSPEATLNLENADENNSGQGPVDTYPEGVLGWSWGAFLLNWIWALGNKTPIGLLCLVPYLGFVFSFVLGAKGRKWAWEKKRWESVEHFNRVQKTWTIWSLILVVGVFGIGILAAIALPAYMDYTQNY
ncbi:MAG: hypothetical protein HRU38_05790 [Saccharospirillaceae bacterium]|nr:hypothetical protein [Pseudomonadales bacterium]NRB78168.1 hypothetical protein [Saccharospirillaceae bacterium]